MVRVIDSVIVRWRGEGVHRGRGITESVKWEMGLGVETGVRIRESESGAGD